ncbi:hypothetical protein ACTJJ4_07490 [Microbacterium sp. 22195]|uniref:hypothetical protein n=1 Tax=Microbacterium sp. 22195 TaxID=3453891 RepID=UPI003F858DE8
MSACEVCSATTFKSREPFALTCHTCGKELCSAHAHYYVDESNVAITQSARPTCATCNGMVTVHCFWSKCSHIVEHRGPEKAARIMQEHYDTSHAADLTALGFPTDDKPPARFEVRIKGDRALSCEDRAEAERWAEVLGTDYAPATVHDAHATPGGCKKTPEANAPTLFDLLDIEGSAA